MIIIASYTNVSVTYTADGVQTVFSFPFDYLRKAFVYVEENSETVLEQGVDYTVDSKTVVFPSAPAEGTVLRIYRETSTTRLVSWADASVLRASDMTVQQVQELHILEEQEYWIKENAIVRNGTQWDAKGFPIKNVGDPVDDKDAATKEYIDDTYETVKGKLDDLDDAIEAAEDAQEAAEDAQEAAEDAQEAAEDAADKAEEILDEIAERSALWFNTVADMKASEELIPGSFAGTKGYYSLNDGNGASYTIRVAEVGETGDDEDTILLDNGNIAERIKSRSDIISSMVDKLDLMRSPFLSVRYFDGYTATQGMCIAEDYLIVTVHEDTELDGRLYVIDIENKTVVGYVDGVTGHMNSVCYDADNKLVCVTGVAETPSYIHRYSFISGVLTYVDSVNPPTPSGSCYGISWNNGYYYLRDASNGALIIVSKDLINEDKRVTIQRGMTLTNQGLFVDDNFIYAPYTGDDVQERIHIYDKDNGSLLKVFSYPRGTFGELEEVATYNGYIFIAINRPVDDNIVGIYKIPLYHKTREELDYSRGNKVFEQDADITILYVNNSDTFAFPDGSSDHPFNSLYEAIRMSQLYNAVAAINVTGTYNNITIQYSGKMLTFNLTNATSDKITVRDSIVRLSSVTCKKIEAYRSVLVLNGGTLDSDSTESNAILNDRSLIVGSLDKIQKYTGAAINGLCGWTSLFVTTISNVSSTFYRRSDRSNNGVVNGILYTGGSYAAEISASTNLNTLTNLGEYYCSTATIAAGLSNCPTTKSFFMTVHIRHYEGWIMQQITDFDGHIYTRGQLTDGTWSTWHKVTAT